MPGQAVYGMLLPTSPPFIHAGKNRRGVEGALAVRRLATCDDLRPLLAPLLHEPVHALAMVRGDQRSHLRLGIERIPDLQLGGLCRELRDDLVVERLLDEHARPRLTALPGRVEERPDGARSRIREIPVRDDELRALAAVLAP